ncbi:MAG: hypothetical protein VKK32_07055 [Candidatus Melainabacteria bacterium]|nr:hypothetical protein [Candidatus Melainabacteria bacterium]
MADPRTSSVNSNNSPVNLDFLLNTPRLTGVPTADALFRGIQQSAGNQALMKLGADLRNLHNRSLAQRLAVEGEALEPSHSAPINTVSSQIPREAVGLSSPELAPDQISSFANAVQIPQAWSEIKSEIFPLHEQYLSGRNTLADSVMGNKLSTLAALFVTPPLGLAALMNHKSSQQILQKISERQVNFLVKAINGDGTDPSGTLKQVLINTAQSLDLLNGLSVDTAKQVAESGSPAAPAIKLAIGLFKAVDKSDLSVTSADQTISGTDIVAMREFLHESIALLDRPVEDIKLKIDSGSGLTALKVFVEAMTRAPAYIEGKYNKLRDPLVDLGVSKQQSDQVTGFLKNIITRVKDLFRTGADQAAKIVNDNASDAQAKTTAGLLELANRISTSSEAQQVVSDAGDGLRQVAPLVGQITQTAAVTLKDQLKSIGMAAEQMSRANKPN